MAPVGIGSLLNGRREWSYIGNFEGRCRILSPVGLPSKFYARSWVGQHLECKSSPDEIVEGIRNYYPYISTIHAILNPLVLNVSTSSSCPF
jgi:hypothetical protein